MESFYLLSKSFDDLYKKNDVNSMKNIISQMEEMLKSELTSELINLYCSILYESMCIYNSLQKTFNAKKTIIYIYIDKSFSSKTDIEWKKFYINDKSDYTKFDIHYDNIQKYQNNIKNKRESIIFINNDQKYIINDDTITLDNLNKLTLS